MKIQLIKNYDERNYQFKSIELFQPFIIKKMIQLNIIYNIREGKRKIKENKEISLKILEKIIKNLWLERNKFFSKYNK